MRRVSRSAYYAFAGGKSYVLSQAKTVLAEQVKDVFYRHRRRYGSRRIRAEVVAQEIKVGRFAVRSAMRRQSLRAISPRRFVPRTTDSRHGVAPSPNLLLDAASAPHKPRQVIVGDITYLPLASGGWSYLASWQDKFTKRIVGWAVAERMTDELVTSAFAKAIASGGIRAGTIVHTDQGSQARLDRFAADARPSRLPPEHEPPRQLLRQPRPPRASSPGSRLSYSKAACSLT